MSILQRMREIPPSLKKILGVVFIVIGLLALVTPLTPGSWIALLGLEFLGIRFLFLDKISSWWKSRKEIKTDSK
ncbi:MAG TPA: hypothetical protein VJ579_05090 [Candidatus Paceibacterota bacterium]|nr:hypothetical protein [Candidatus Paceibacterota bacterium]